MFFSRIASFSSSSALSITDTGRFLARRTFFNFFSSPSLLPGSPLGRRHSEGLLVGFTPDQLFNVVSNVNEYKKFVPWCVDSRILRYSDNGRQMDAELHVGFRILSERYLSDVRLRRPNSVQVVVREGRMFHHLATEWEFRPGPVEGTSWLVFVVDFRFSNSLHQNLANVFFREVVLTMRDSFEKRCAQIYGPSSCPTRKIWSETTESASSPPR